MLLTTVQDISLGGACIASEVMPLYGTEIELLIQIPGAQHVSRLPGTVRWATRGRFGVQFGLLGARETHLIASLIQRRVVQAGRLETLRPGVDAHTEVVRQD